MFYCGIPVISKYVILQPAMKYIILSILFVLWTNISPFLLIKLYAPADTENVPILTKKDRKNKQLLSYITFSIGILIAGIVNYNIIYNIIIFGYFLQTIMITKIAYRLTNNKYGYEVYGKDTSTQNV